MRGGSRSPTARAGRSERRSAAAAPAGLRTRELAYIGRDHRVAEISLTTGRHHLVGELRGRSVAWGAQPGLSRCLTPVGAHTVSTGSASTVYASTLADLALTGKTLSYTDDGVAETLVLP